MSLKRSLPAIVILFTNALGATLVIPILPLLALESFGATVLQAILLESSYYGAKLLAAPILGRLSDQYGRRPILILSQAGTFFSFLLFIAALPIGQLIEQALPYSFINGGLLMLYLARMFDGATGGNTTVAKAYITDVTAQEDHAQAFGWLSATLGIGFVIGPAVGGLLASSWGLLSPFYAGAAVSAVALILAWLLLSETRPVDDKTFNKNTLPFWNSFKTVVRQPTFAKILIIGLLSTLCFAALSPTFVLYVNEVIFPGNVDPAEVSRFVGFLYTIVGLTLAITQIAFIKPLVTIVGEQRLVQISQIGMIFSFLLIPIARSPYLFLGLLVPFVIFYAILEPNLQALLAQTGPKEKQGESFGLYQSVLSVSDLLGPLWAGIVFQQISPQAVWWGAAVILLPAMAVAMFLRKPSSDSALKLREGLVQDG
ncbi:MAG: MFS transporter [Ardenticatenaceae bacterium]|nr:MFS transporter [Ardenticatenaceae bacterium]